MNKIRGILYFGLSFLISLVFVVVSLNSYDSTLIAEIQNTHFSSEDLSQTYVGASNHQSGFDKQHTAHLKVYKKFFRYKKRGRHQEVRFDVSQYPKEGVTYTFIAKVSNLHTSDFVPSYLSDCFQLRGPPSASV